MRLRLFRLSARGETGGWLRYAIQSLRYTAGRDYLARELLANEGIAVDIQAEKSDELKGPGELSYRPPRSPHCDRGLSQS